MPEIPFSDVLVKGASSIGGNLSGFAETGTYQDSNESIAALTELDVSISLSKKGYKWGEIWLSNSATHGIAGAYGVRVHFSDSDSEACSAEIRIYGLTYSKSLGHAYLSGLNFGFGKIRLNSVYLDADGDTLHLIFYNTDSTTARQLIAYAFYGVVQGHTEKSNLIPFDSVDVKDTLSVAGAIEGLVNSGVEYISQSIGGGYFNYYISIDKGGYTAGRAFIIRGNVPLITGNGGVIVHFTATTGQGDGQEVYTQYGKTYSKYAGASFLSGLIFPGFIRLDDMYIDNANSRIALRFWNSSGLSKPLYATVHWGLIQ